ncbi:hypothetical protein HK098_000464 [Nowakowskiella sp. JEL0407]|nr:hypothetical protein HK098_000464 [Nowakowskiella sp. JEL0407]
MLAQWMIYYIKNAQQSVKTWESSLASAPKERKLAYIHLANEILQLSKKKSNAFEIEFKPVLQLSLKQTCDAVPECLSKIGRVLEIWSQRSVYSDEFLNVIRKDLGLQAYRSPLNSSPPAKQDHHTAHVPKYYPEVQAILTLTQKISSSVSSTQTSNSGSDRQELKSKKIAELDLRRELEQAVSNYLSSIQSGIVKCEEELQALEESSPTSNTENYTPKFVFPNSTDPLMNERRMFEYHSKFDNDKLWEGTSSFTQNGAKVKKIVPKPSWFESKKLYKLSLPKMLSESKTNPSTHVNGISPIGASPEGKYVNSHVLQLEHVNQGTAFSPQIRAKLHLRGLLPPKVEDLAHQVERAKAFMARLEKPLSKFLYLDRLKNEDSTLFYKLVMENPKELCPIIYTPLVGTVCQDFSLLYTPSFHQGLFLSLDDFDHLEECLNNWPHPHPHIAVITDGSRILGLGDLGVNGLGIPIGKLDLYIAAGGFSPLHTLPIVLDLGTNTEKYLNDPFYIGTKRPRASDEVFFKFVDAVMAAIHKKFPETVIQFEDFSTEHAFSTLERYRNKYTMFNDDIQGTGAVILSGFINAVKISGIPIKDQKIVFFGAGSAGVGVAKQIQEFFIKDGGMTEEESKDLFWLVDTKGLVTFDRGDKLPSHKVLFARSDNNGKQYGTLQEILDYVKPTALIGLSSTSGAFSPEIIRQMKGYNERPIIFPLSNPSSKAECSFDDAMTNTDKKVLFASGTAFPSYFDGEKEYIPGQGNNMYIFPGLGLGTYLSSSTTISDSMIYASAKTLAASLSPKEIAADSLYPEINRIREISAQVALGVMKTAVAEGYAKNPEVIELVKKIAATGAEGEKEGVKYVTDRMYFPKYSSDDVVVREVRNYDAL